MIVQLSTPLPLPGHRQWLMEVEQLAWSSDGTNIAAGDLKVHRRLEAFAPGVTLAVIHDADGEILSAGSQYAFQLNWDGDPASLTSWDELTHEGWYDQVHVPGGNTGFLVGVGVVPECRGRRFGPVLYDPADPHHLAAVELGDDSVAGPELHPHARWTGSYKLSELLIARTLDVLFQHGVHHVIGNARVPAYHQRPDLPIAEYCALRRADGQLFDPVLRFHERMGARVFKPVAYSMEDAESRNAGCWVVYDQPFAG